MVRPLGAAFRGRAAWGGDDEDEDEDDDRQAGHLQPRSRRSRPFSGLWRRPAHGFLLSCSASRGPRGRGGEKYPGAPRGPGRPLRSTRPPPRRARAPCEGGIRPAPDSSRAPPAPGGPRPPPTGGRGDRPRGGGGAGSEAAAAPPRACGSLRPRGAAGTCLCLCGAGAAGRGPRRVFAQLPRRGFRKVVFLLRVDRSRGSPHPVLKPRSERSRLLGCVSVRHVFCGDFRRKIAAGPWEKKCYMP